MTMHVETSTPIKVASDSRVHAVAGSIAAMIRETGHAEVRAVGAGAVNQAVKAMAVAVDFLKHDEIKIGFTPHFLEISIDGKRRTAMQFSVDCVQR